MDIMSLNRLAQEIGGPLPLIAGMGGSLMEPTGFILMNVKVPCVQGYDEDQVALVMDCKVPFAGFCRVWTFYQSSCCLHKFFLVFSFRGVRFCFGEYL